MVMRARHHLAFNLNFKYYPLFNNLIFVKKKKKFIISYHYPKIPVENNPGNFNLLIRSSIIVAIFIYSIRKILLILFVNEKKKNYCGAD